MVIFSLNPAVNIPDSSGRHHPFRGRPASDLRRPGKPIQKWTFYLPVESQKRLPFTNQLHSQVTKKTMFDYKDGMSFS